MATQYGVTLTGFVIKPFTECLAEAEAALQAIFGNTIALDPSQPFGQLAQTMAESEFELWEGMQAVYTARDPDGAEGAGLIELSAITGTIPLTPSPSTVVETLCGTNGTVIPQNSLIGVNPTGIQYETSASATLTSAPAWVATTGYSVGNYVTNGGNVYQCTVPGISAGSGGPSGTGSAISDGSVTWEYVGSGTAVATVVCDSVENGDQQALAGTLTQIQSPVSGWSSALNLLDYTPGQAVESDADLRIRRLEELSANGLGTIDAIIGKLAALTNDAGQALLTSANVYENDGDTTDSFGLPPHSIQAIVLYPGAPISATDQTVAATLLASKPGGIATYGAQTQTVKDVQGYSHTINFDYPTEKWVWIQVNLSINSATYAGDTAVAVALVNWANANLTSGDTVPTGLLFGAITDAVPGVVDIEEILTGISAVGGGMPTLTAASKTMARNQLPLFDTSRISITHI